MSTLHLWPEQPTLQAGQIETGFVLENVSKERQRCWYRLPAGLQGAISESCDPFVLASLFTAMGLPAALYVHGAVSPSLLYNLEEFQAIWHAWLPDRYQPVDIRADSEQEAPRAAGSAAIMAFSGGLDSSFTAWRHRTAQAGRQTEDLQAGMIVHGFDIPLKHKEAFGVAFDRSQIMLHSLGMQAIPLATNLRALGGVLGEVFAPLLASCLSLLEKRFSIGLIANSRPNYVLVNPWALPYGSNALSDRFLSSRAFTIRHDGADYSRFDKTQALAGWPEAMNNLRVCLGHNPLARVRNCCMCEKCIRNILTFRLLGLGLPACFERDVSDRQILRMSYSHPMHFSYFNEILEKAHQRAVRASWVRALRLSVILNRMKLPYRQSNLLDKIRSQGK
jgi:hypothetical protein